MQLKCVPCACCNRDAILFNEGLAVEAHDLDGHDCSCHHLLHGVLWWDLVPLLYFEIVSCELFVDGQTTEG